MKDYLLAGFLMGTLLYIAKMGTMYLVKKVLFFMKPIFESTFGLLVIDLGFGYLGTQTLASVGMQGLTAGFVLITFSVWTFLYIFFKIGMKKVRILYHSYI